MDERSSNHIDLLRMIQEERRESKPSFLFLRGIGLDAEDEQRYNKPENCTSHWMFSSGLGEIPYRR